MGLDVRGTAVLFHLDLDPIPTYTYILLHSVQSAFLLCQYIHR